MDLHCDFASPDTNPVTTGRPARESTSVTLTGKTDSPDLSDFAARVQREASRRLQRSSAPGGVGRWFRLDLELGYGTIPASHSDSRPLSCQRTSQPGGKDHLWGQARRQTMDPGAL